MDFQLDDIIPKLILPLFAMLIGILVIKSIETSKKIKAAKPDEKPKRNIPKIILAIIFIPVLILILYIGFTELTGEGISFLKVFRAAKI